MFIRSLFSFILLSFIVASTHAQVTVKGVKPRMRGPKTSTASTFTMDQLQGKWQEYQRINLKSNSDVSFNDTAQLYFIDNENAVTKTTSSNSMTMKGSADIDDENVLTVVTDVYTIVSVTKDNMELDDDNYKHLFKRVDAFWGK
ncbi:MAG: hypothetical protein WDM71_01050 [Ferruginibacter sp.]